MARQATILRRSFLSEPIGQRERLVEVGFSLVEQTPAHDVREPDSRVRHREIRIEGDGFLQQGDCVGIVHVRRLLDAHRVVPVGLETGRHDIGNRPRAGSSHGSPEMSAEPGGEQVDLTKQRSR